MNNFSEQHITVLRCAAMLSDCPESLLTAETLGPVEEGRWLVVSKACNLKLEGTLSEAGDSFLMTSRAEYPWDTAEEVLISDPRSAYKVFYNRKQQYVRETAPGYRDSYWEGVEIQNSPGRNLGHLAAYFLARDRAEIAAASNLPKADAASGELVTAKLRHWDSEQQVETKGESIRVSYQPATTQAFVDILDAEGVCVLTAMAEYGDKGPIIHLSGSNDRVCAAVIDEGEDQIRVEVERDSSSLASVIHV